MAPGIDMSDKNAWDDSLLINSWNDAVEEYEVSSPAQHEILRLTWRRNTIASTSLASDSRTR
jgi:hypothetical protein